jgi:hypothetical protein
MDAQNETLKRWIELLGDLGEQSEMNNLKEILTVMVEYNQELKNKIRKLSSIIYHLNSKNKTLKVRQNENY